MSDKKAGTLDGFCDGQFESARLANAVLEILDETGPYCVRVGKSQVAFRRRVAYAWVWIPRVVLRGRGAPLVLSVGLHRRDTIVEWKQVVEPHPGRFTHHLELWAISDLNEAVRTILIEAWGDAALPLTNDTDLLRSGWD